MTIHAGHPFADADPDPVRRFRGRLGGAVTLWTAGAAADRRPDGHLGDDRRGRAGGALALLDPDADLTARLEDTGRGVVALLVAAPAARRRLPRACSAPGGAFRTGAFEDSDAGPRLEDAQGWAEVELEEVRDVGWSRLVTCTVGTVVIGDDDEALGHRRGRWVRGQGRPHDRSRRASSRSG